jgi:hypothetical protein
MIVTDSRDIFSGAEGLDAAAWPDWPGWPEAFEETSVDMGVLAADSNTLPAAVIPAHGIFLPARVG